jgi:hypothetical protein
MAHKRKDTFCASGSWSKRLKPHGKKVMAKAERRAARKAIIDARRMVDFLDRDVICHNFAFEKA